MDDSFLDYLSKFLSPADIWGKAMEEFTGRLIEYHKFIGEKDRDEAPELFEVGRALRSFGAPMESYKLFKADAEYYKYRGDDKRSWQQLCYAGAFANLGYPTKGIEEESLGYCEIQRREKECLPFLPLFLNNYAGILHIYREDYQSANALYREAISLMEEIEPQKYEEIVGREYLWAHKLISNNYIDSLLVTERNEEDEKELLRMIDIAEMRLNNTESEYARVLTLLNRAEIRARRGEEEEADKILHDIISNASDKVERFVRPAYHRIKALIFAEKGDRKESMKFMIRALQESGHYGNTLEETLTMRDTIFIYSSLASKSNVENRYQFYKENGLFDYLVSVLKIKDWFLGAEHSVNVSKTAGGIASILSMSPERIRLISTTALLHDIGKFVIPWYSLNKISKLDSLDWAVLRSHPAEGGRLLRKLGLEKEAEIVENHHERIDGSGYPNGIKDIDIETEIVAVSDVYNASITPNRKYRVPKSPGEAFLEIKNGKRGKFSRAVINGLKQYIESETT
ncbi:HD domain-containing protein [candidate division WOR-3 bacterium]|nr:HD domain-containing protein [candidate division WOR-3 bacterium]